jgi:hypothetical protein
MAALQGWLYLEPVADSTPSSLQVLEAVQPGGASTIQSAFGPGQVEARLAANLHDAVYLFARAADALLRQGTALNYRGALLKELKNTTFVGLSGRVTLDPQGDRVEQLGIINFAVRGKSHCHSAANCSGIVGLYDRQLEIFVPNLRYQPMWPGGTADPPSGLCPNQR